MESMKYNVLGVMSGTSLDGIDIAHVEFEVVEDNWRFEIFQAETISYPEIWLPKLKIAVQKDKDELCQLNEEYTEFLGGVINNFIKKNAIEGLDAVCSHGHTVLHQPQKGYTLQIGNLPALASLINQRVVCDFRVQDVQKGGQGAPLVPIGDKILFSAYDYCLNLGGFSNISFEMDGKRIAYDISPVNTVLNHYAEKLGCDYDAGGHLARRGALNEDLFNQLNSLSFYAKPFPKSLGIEYVNEFILPLMETCDFVKIEDALCTFVEHIAYQISRNVLKKNVKLLVTGGGAYNDFLVERMRFYLSEIELVIPEKSIIEFKEALIFALLGVLKLRNEINLLSSVTGAYEDHCSGVIFEKV